MHKCMICGRNKCEEELEVCDDCLIIFEEEMKEFCGDCE